MRYVLISQAEIGMILAKPVLDETGRVLITREAVLSNVFIDKLTQLGVGGIYIEDALSEDIDIDEPISPALKTAGYTAVRNKNIDQCLIVAKQIVEEMLKKGTVSMDMNDLRTFDNYTYAHSMNVAVLACTVGMGMKLKDKELEELVLAGLLHDLGKLDIPDEILNKPGRLTQEEYALIKAHPTLSYELIKDRIDISALTKNAVLCHHENYDGTGYPKGLAGHDITRMASILHVVDVYDALTSKRPYKEPYSPFAAIEILKGGRGTLYDPEILDAFLKSVPIYPKGTYIKVGDNIRGIVVDNSGKHNMRPLIRLEDMTMLDLSAPENLTLDIMGPAEQDYFKIVQEEEERKSMIAEIRHYRVMVIDSDADTYNNLVSKMSYLYDFVHAETDGLAEGYIRKNGRPDLVLIDVDYRDLSDFEDLVNKYSRMSKIVPIIVLGSFSDIKLISMMKSIGVQNYVLKPYRIIYLQSEIRRAIENWSFNNSRH